MSIIRQGTTVKIISGREGGKVSLSGKGDIGKVHHTCEYTGFRFLILKKHKKDPVYRDHIFGPYADCELEAVRHATD